MSNLKSIELTASDISKIEEVLRVKGNDFIVFQGLGDKIRFMVDNSEMFKYLELEKEDCGRFNLRLPKESLKVVLAVGIITVGEEEGNTVIAYYSGAGEYERGDFSRFIRVDVERDIGVSSRDIYQLVSLTETEQSIELDNVGLIDTLYGYSRVGNNGIMFSNDYMYTEGEGFKVFAKIKEGQMNLTMTMDGVREISRLSKIYNLKSINMWDIENYLIIKFDDIVFGCRKIRNTKFRELEGFFEMEPIARTVIDFKSINSLMKGIRITKTGKYSLAVDFERKIVQVRDSKVGDYISKVSCSGDLGGKMLKLNVRVLKNVVELIGNNAVDVNVYENIVSIENVHGVVLLLRRE